ncbi:methyltransferase domain-containing protein [Elizabethkingia argentiflava]|uniref:Methyltransferase domain-containing protein n=1 Tax=Elizabethkingia argenteiflava TaxID=2681556 RepID=A0A845PY35_9FLAO|nr:O-methyltransferase [Elizabethkingia argenteiflava]NAW51268.1 methyltransferase domain-containing protein [Elizabethkingia argenteiflava]
MAIFEEKFPEIERYMEDNASAEPDILKSLRRETFQKTTQPHMISGYLQGRFLSIFSHLLKPKNILEIGTFTGYATLSLAEGLAEGGTIYTLDKNEDLSYLPKKYFEQSEYANQIKFILGDAREEIQKINEIFDLVFLDADKESYVDYIRLIKPKLRKGGVILIDNVLWYGKVIEENPKDKSTQQIKLVNKVVTEDPDFENVILPLRDGVHLIRKK